MRIFLTTLFLLAALAAPAAAQTPISALPSATPAATDAVPFVTMGTTPKVTKRTTFADFFSLLQPGHVASGNKNGTGSKFQLFGGGSVATDDCAKFDASGNVVSAGAGCAVANTGADATLSPDFAITGANDTFLDTGLSLSLPSAGTYLISCDVRAHILYTAGSNVAVIVKLYNSTDAAYLSNTERILGAPSASTLFIVTTHTQAVATVAGAKTVKLYAARTGGTTWSTSSVVSDASGRTMCLYVKLSN